MRVTCVDLLFSHTLYVQSCAASYLFVCVCFKCLLISCSHNVSTLILHLGQSAHTLTTILISNTTTPSAIWLQYDLSAKLQRREQITQWRSDHCVDLQLCVQNTRTMQRDWQNRSTLYCTQWRSGSMLQTRMFTCLICSITDWQQLWECL